MNPLITRLFFLALSVCTAQGANCNDNPCQLGGYYSQANGYRCVQRGGFADCYCPGGEYEVDQPCRICDRVDPKRNPCDDNNPNFIACLETKDYGSSYVCLFEDAAGNPVATLDFSGNLAVTLTSSSTTTTTTLAPGVGGACLNGGVFYAGGCNCPSGFIGSTCQSRDEFGLCQGVTCKNGGFCAVRQPNGPYEAVCACKAGFFGEYCEIQGTLGSCSTGYCLNNGACREFVAGSTRYAYCECPGAFKGVKCGDRYFDCPAAGNWTDIELFTQGRYFECTTLASGGFRIQRRSCAKGLRFNMNANLCTR